MRRKLGMVISQRLSTPHWIAMGSVLRCPVRTLSGRGAADRTPEHPLPVGKTTPPIPSSVLLEDSALVQRLTDQVKAAILAECPNLSRLSEETEVSLTSRKKSDDAHHSNAGPHSVVRDGLPQSVLRATVKIFASSSLPNCIMPWQKRQQLSVSGSGFVIDTDRRLIITNAHVVHGAQFVEVRKHGDSNNHTGYVVYLGTDCDMALVHVADEAFWEEAGLTALAFDVPESANAKNGELSSLEQLAGMHARYEAFGGLPHLQDGVKVVGYPVGGDQLSITSGVVSRIEVSSYGRDTPFALLTVQIDAAINHGNSGGPALSTRTKRVIGIAFQVLGNAESIGYIIPLPIVASFLNTYLISLKEKKEALVERGVERLHDGSVPMRSVVDAETPVADPPQPQKASAAPSSSSSAVITERAYFPHAPTLGIYYQVLLNKHLRAYYGLQPHQTGILVSGTAFQSPAEGVLRPNDVILSLSGFPVENDGTIAFRPHERVLFTHLVHVCPPGSSVELQVLRKKDADRHETGAPSSFDDYEEIAVSLRPRSLGSLVRQNLQTEEFREKPKYCMFGGLVFSTLTHALLCEWGEQWYNTAPRWLVEQLSAVCTAERDEVVVVVQVIPHPVNQSYESLYARVVCKVGEVPVRNFSHFRTLIKEHRDRVVLPPQEGTVSNKDYTNLILHTKALGELTKVAVLPIAEALEADRQLEDIYQIPPQQWN